MCVGRFLFFLSQMLNRRTNVVLAYNGGDWRSKSLVLTLKFSTTPDGFYFANCVLAAVFFLFDFQHFKK